MKVEGTGDENDTRSRRIINPLNTSSDMDSNNVEVDLASLGSSAPSKIESAKDDMESLQLKHDNALPGY